MDSILYPLVLVFTWIWVGIHNFLTLIGIPDGPGFGWILSIIVYTIVIRILILPLYIKQMKSMRMMQVLQPEQKKIQDKYKKKTDQVSRQRKNEEIMALYRKAGVSPYASCWPILIQLPFLFALYRTIYSVEAVRNGTYIREAIGPLDATLADQINSSSVFGVFLNQSFSSVTTTGGKSVFIVLTCIMCLVQFLTLYMSMKRNTPANIDKSNPMYGTQKSMTYVMPFLFVITGLILQMGVLAYTMTTAIFSLVQQWFVIRLMPTNNSPAYNSLLLRREKNYKSWSSNYFANYQQKLAQINNKDIEEKKLYQRNIVEDIVKNAKKWRIPTKFPNNWTDEEIISIFQELSTQQWKTIPDNTWLYELIKKKKLTETNQTDLRKKARKKTRQQRINERNIGLDEEKVKNIKAREKEERRKLKGKNQ